MMDYWLMIAAVAAFGGCLAVSLVFGRHPETGMEEELARLKIRVDMLTAAAKPPQLSRTEGVTYMVLAAVADGPKTARQIQTELGQSREHVARLVKKMSEEGYLKREGTRPFVYTITPEGRQTLESASTGA